MSNGRKLLTNLRGNPEQVTEALMLKACFGRRRNFMKSLGWRAKIEEQNRFMVRRQRELRTAADVVTKAWTAFPEVQALAVLGSVAKPLWKEVPRFRRSASLVVRIALCSNAIQRHLSSRNGSCV